MRPVIKAQWKIIPDSMLEQESPTPSPQPCTRLWPIEKHIEKAQVGGKHGSVQSSSYANGTCLCKTILSHPFLLSPLVHGARKLEDHCARGYQYSPHANPYYHHISDLLNCYILHNCSIIYVVYVVLLAPFYIIKYD